MAKILIGIGFIITLVSGLAIFYATQVGMRATQTETGGAAAVAEIAWAFSAAYLASYANVFGLLILTVGILVNLFTKKKITY